MKRNNTTINHNLDKKEKEKIMEILVFIGIIGFGVLAVECFDDADKKFWKWLES